MYLDQSIEAPYVVDDVTETTLSQVNDLTLSPNPAPSGTSSISLSGLLNGTNRIVMFDASGRQVWTGELISGGTKGVLNLESIAPGLYQIQVLGMDGTVQTARLSVR